MSLQAWKPDFLSTSPLFEPLRIFSDGFEKLACWPDLTDFACLADGAGKQIITRSGKPVCFVGEESPVAELDKQYEARIYLTGEVQTRLNNWHDLFNALVWLTFPNTKAELNHLHYQASRREWQAGQKQRGPLRDAVTLFDESGVVVVSSEDNLIKLLREFEWKALFWERRAELIKCMKFFLFGHGLYEKALNPYVGMTGKGVSLLVDKNFFSQPMSVQLAVIDLKLVDFVRQHLTATKDLMPVPVLGYPDWSLDNADEIYYDNRHYFRFPKRLSGRYFEK